MADQEVVFLPTAPVIAGDIGAERGRGDCERTGSLDQGVDGHDGLQPAQHRQQIAAEDQNRIVSWVLSLGGDRIVDRLDGEGGLESVDGDRLAGQEAEAFPIDSFLRDRAAIAAGIGRVGERAGGFDWPCWVECPFDDQTVIALAQHQVHDLNGRDALIGGKAALSEANAAEADAAGDDIRLAEDAGRCRSEVEIVRHAKAAQRRLGHHAGTVFLAAIVVNVEHVDLLAFGRLLADPEEEAVLLAREFQPVNQRSVGAGDATFNLQRSAQFREEMLRGWEDLGPLARNRRIEERIRLEADALLDEVIGVVEAGLGADADHPYIVGGAVGQPKG